MQKQIALAILFTLLLVSYVQAMCVQKISTGYHTFSLGGKAYVFSFNGFYTGEPIKAAVTAYTDGFFIAGLAFVEEGHSLGVPEGEFMLDDFEVDRHGKGNLTISYAGCEEPAEVPEFSGAAFAMALIGATSVFLFVKKR